MKRLLVAIFAFSLAWPAFATQDALEPTLEQRLSKQKEYRIPWVPTQQKWVTMKFIGGEDQIHRVITLLYPDEACSMMIPREDEATCYWYWQLLPEAPRSIRDDEAIVVIGSYFAWVTEQEYCAMVKGAHRMSSPKLDLICRESWFEFYLDRADIPDTIKLVYPF